MNIKKYWIYNTVVLVEGIVINILAIANILQDKDVWWKLNAPITIILLLLVEPMVFPTSLKIRIPNRGIKILLVTVWIITFILTTIF